MMRYGQDPKGYWSWKSPDRWSDGEIEVSDAGGKTAIAITQEKAVDSYNSEFTCEVTLERPQLADLHAFLSRVLQLSWMPIDDRTPQDGATPILVRGQTATGMQCAVLQMVHWEGGGSAWCYRVRGSFMPAGWTPTEWIPVPGGEVAL